MIPRHPRRIGLALAGFELARVLGALPARADDAKPIAITHALVYVPGPQPPLPDATVCIAGGKVIALGATAQAPADARVYDGRGKTVTAGFIDADTDVGAVEISMERPSNEAEGGRGMAPALRMIDGYNPRSALIPVARSGGVTSVIVAPRDGALAGRGAFVDLAGDTLAEAVVRPLVAQYARADEGEAIEMGTRGALWSALRQAFDDARFYADHRGAYEANAMRALGLRRLDLEALLPVLRGEQPIVMTVHRASDIENALHFAAELKLRIILRGASEAWLVTDDIAKAKVPVIIDPLEDLPDHFDRLRSRSDNATLLSAAGVSVILSTFSSHQVRLLWQHAGNAVRLGMNHDAAIRAVTEAPADAFGLKGYGRLEPGAVANVVIWSGDPLQIGTRVEHVLVRGREPPRETRQTLLLNRYRSLPFAHDGAR